MTTEQSKQAPVISLNVAHATLEKQTILESMTETLLKRTAYGNQFTMIMPALILFLNKVSVEQKAGFAEVLAPEAEAFYARMVTLVIEHFGDNVMIFEDVKKAITPGLLDLIAMGVPDDLTSEKAAKAGSDLIHKGIADILKARATADETASPSPTEPPDRRQRKYRQK